MEIDLTQDIGTGAGDPGPVVEQARRMMRLEMEIAQLEMKAVEKKAELDKLSCELLPELMDSLGIQSLSLSNGYELELKPVLRASLPAKSTIEKASDDDRPQLLARFNDGLKWLRKMKAADLIKNTLRIDLGKNQDAAAKQFVALAKQLKVTVDCSQTVHPGSLGSFIKEKLADGVDVPFETFAVFSGRKAEIKPPKKGKGVK